MHPLFEQASALTGEVIEAAIEVQKQQKKWQKMLAKITGHFFFYF